MKTHSFLTSIATLFAGMVLLTSCGHEKVRQYSVDLTYADGTTESYPMMAGNMLLINQGNTHIVAKATEGTESTLDFQVVSYSSSRDTTRRENTIKKTGANTTKLALSKSMPLDPSGGVQVKLTSMAMIDTGNGPKGGCLGNCCEAKCFSTWCCSDPDECKDTTCDCKPPSNCPGQDPTPQPARFFELFKSGKEILVLND